MIALGLFSLLTAQTPQPFARPFLRPGHSFIVSAHRGDHTVAPENTLDAIREAIKDDVDFVELDLRLDKDGEIVIMHDRTVDRTTDGKGAVSDLTTTEIRSLRIKGARNADEKVPTFEETLQLAKGKVFIYMDINSVSPAQVLPLLKKYRMERDVIAYVYTAKQRDEWRKGAPAIPLISDLEGGLKSVGQIETDWKASPFAITDGDVRGYTKEFVDKFHALGVAVVPDGQNPLESPAQWEPFIAVGLDGLQTDHPGALVKWLKSKGIR